LGISSHAPRIAWRIAAKGQANDETLSAVIAEGIGVASGSLIIQASEALRGG
jgi:hypothetical protein